MSKKVIKSTRKSPIKEGIESIPYKFKKIKHVGYYNPKDLKPKKKHYATKLKEERDDLERKLFHLYRMWKGEDSKISGKVLLKWLKYNEPINHIAVSRSTIRITGTRRSKIKWIK